MNKIDELRQDIADIKSGMSVETDPDMIELLRENLQIAESELEQAVMKDDAPLPSPISEIVPSEAEKSKPSRKPKKEKFKKERVPPVVISGDDIDIDLTDTQYQNERIYKKGEITCIIDVDFKVEKNDNDDDKIKIFFDDDQNWIYPVDAHVKNAYPKGEEFGYKVEDWAYVKGSKKDEIAITVIFEFYEPYDSENIDLKPLVDAKPKSKKQKPLQQKGSTLTWEQPVVADQLQYAELGMLTCDMKFITATSKVGVIVPTEAEEGDIIVLDAKSNRPMMVIKKQYAKRKCLTLKEGETAHVVIEKPDESIQKVELVESGRKETPIMQVEDVHNEKPTEKDIEIIKATHQSDCTIAEYNRDMPNVPVRTWLEDMVERFNSNKSNLYVTKVLISKEGEVFAKIANKSALGWMVTPEWYQICPDSGRMSILQKQPKKGSYEVEVDEKEIKEFYSDSDDYSKCRHWMSEIYKIRMGEADGDKKALYKKWAESCRNSNLVARYKKLHQYIHKKARKIREEKPNKYDTHYEAVRAVRAMLKKAETMMKD